MADASEALGAQELAGTWVMPKGMTKTMGVGAIGGAVGALAAGALASRKKGAGPQIGRTGYLALTDTELALLKGKSGLLKMKLGEVVARVPRSEVASSELDGKLLKANLKIAFTDGGSWEFEVAKANRGKAEKVISALGGRLH